jgi:hypothetical protein
MRATDGSCESVRYNRDVLSALQEALLRLMLTLVLVDVLDLCVYAEYTGIKECPSLRRLQSELGRGAH